MSHPSSLRLRALKTLVAVRQRRCRALEQAVSEAQDRLAESRLAEQAARQALFGVLDQEAAERDKLAQLVDVGQTFDVQTLFARQHAVETMQSKVAQQQEEVERRETAIGGCEQDLRQRRRDATRNEQKIDALKQDMAAIKAARQNEEDDQQDEEAEEASISRMLQARTVSESRGAAR